MFDELPWFKRGLKTIQTREKEQRQGRNVRGIRVGVQDGKAKAEEGEQKS